MRTTIDLDEPILRDLKRLQKQEKKTLGQLVSELVGSALAARKRGERGNREFVWVTRPMGARVDLADKEALFAALDDDSETPGQP